MDLLGFRIIVFTNLGYVGISLYRGKIGMTRQQPRIHLWKYPTEIICALIICLACLIGNVIAAWGVCAGPLWLRRVAVGGRVKQFVFICQGAISWERRNCVMNWLFFSKCVSACYVTFVWIRTTNIALRAIPNESYDWFDRVGALGTLGCAHPLKFVSICVKQYVFICQSARCQAVS